jgi:hypothetical protein
MFDTITSFLRAHGQDWITVPVGSISTVRCSTNTDTKRSPSLQPTSCVKVAQYTQQIPVSLIKQRTIIWWQINITSKNNPWKGWDETYYYYYHYYYCYYYYFCGTGGIPLSAPQPLEAYCVNTALVPRFISRGNPRQTAWETSISERRNRGREMASQI